MPFRVKNITNYNVSLLNILVGPGSDIDLLLYLPVNTVASSLMFGELYQKLIGKLFAIKSPGLDVKYLNLTIDQYNKIASTGLFQGKLGDEDLIPYMPIDPTTGGIVVNNPPFIFDGLGALITSGGGGGPSGPIYVQSQVANSTNVPSGTYSYYIDMNGFRFLGMWLNFGNNTTAILLASGEFNETSSSANYIDLTQVLAQVSVLPANDKHLINIDTPFPFRWVQIQVSVTNGADNSHGIWIEKML